MSHDGSYKAYLEFAYYICFINNVETNFSKHFLESFKKMKFNNRNIFISSKSTIGKNVKIGDNTVIYDNVIVGDNSIICNDCIIGEPPSDYYKNIDHFENPVTEIGDDALIRSHCIIYAGSSFGKHLITGHRSTVREGAVFGDWCFISTRVDIQGNCRIGNYSRLYSNVSIGELTTIGNYVFVFPYTVLTNDPQPPSNILSGATVGDYSIITVHCSILPGIKIGKHCLIGANSVVSSDIRDYSVAIGSPAKIKMDIRKIPSKEKHVQFHYPWPYNFERGMPWQNIGFEKWQQENLDI